MPTTENVLGPQTPQKWVPVIAREDCVGCNRCVLACDHGCIELVWDFATLARAENCGSCGRCEEACPHDVIAMAWDTVAGDTGVGFWRKRPAAAPTSSAPARGWFARLFR